MKGRAVIRALVNPDPAALVNVHVAGVDQVGLGGEESGFQTGGDAHFFYVVEGGLAAKAMGWRRRFNFGLRRQEGR